MVMIGINKVEICREVQAERVWMLVQGFYQLRFMLVIIEVILQEFFQQVV